MEKDLEIMRRVKGSLVCSLDKKHLSLVIFIYLKDFIRKVWINCI